LKILLTLFKAVFLDAITSSETLSNGPPNIIRVAISLYTTSVAGN
jgi:hypothetical protein